MTHRFIGIALCLAAATASAQAPSSVLLEACNALADPEKRLACFKEALRGAPAEPAAHARLKDSVIAMQGAIDAGVSLVQYQAMLLELNKELALFKAKRPFPEIAQVLDQAAEAYADAGQFWAASIRYASRNRNMFIASDVLPDIDLQIAGLAYLPGKYSIPFSRTDAFGLGQGVQRFTGLTTIWRQARILTDKAWQQLDEPADPEPAKGSGT